MTQDLSDLTLELIETLSQKYKTEHSKEGRIEIIRAYDAVLGVLYKNQPDKRVLYTKLFFLQNNTTRGGKIL